ncbi:homoserine dehydrogenase [Firmicutes bacterium CAG:882]|jgi:homoserine dehydrogenase|nr:homoserine dehydrogenase [Firmicutes bacterium CAG:882]
MVNVAVLGYGTVGSGVVEVLGRNAKVLEKNAGEEINLKYVLDLKEFPGTPIEKKVVHDFNIILNDDEVSVIVEVMGGVNPAYSFVKSALLKGKSVCTSNKELVAKHGAELLGIAAQKNVNFFFEASVAGGIPIIRPLEQCITADEILEVSGILNGTTNFMLTKMEKEGASYDGVLKEAQKLGYAERNPEADVEGFDAGRKIAILSSIVCRKQVDFENVYTEGITGVTAEDFAYAAKLGVTIKLVAKSCVTADGMYVMVTPRMLRYGKPLASVHDVVNAVCVKGNMLGDVMFYGAGAGKLPTASAVVSDIVDAVRHAGEYTDNGWSQEKQELISIDEVENCFYVRMEGKASEKEEELKKLFGGVTLCENVIDGEFAFVTGSVKEAEFAKAICSLKGVKNRIRIEL